MNELTVGPMTRVTLHFQLSFEEGGVIDSTFEKTPASLVVGDGKLLAGFEQKILGMKAGQRATYTVLPEEGFGQPNPNNIQRFKREQFAEDMALAEGLVISFADASQSELPGVVKSWTADEVIVDFNHPLAGRNILFEVEIIAVDPAQEL